VIVNIAVFCGFLLIAAVMGFFLWETLFASKDHPAKPHTQTAYSDQQSGNKDSAGASVTPAHTNPAEEAMAEYTRWLAFFTAALVLATVALFISGERNVDVARQSAEAAKDSAEAALKQAVAAERASTAGRAYLFVSYDTPQAPMVSQTDPLWSVPINFTIKNYGQTPAIITNIETHLLIGKDGKPIHDPPDPLSQEATELFEIKKSPGIDIQGGNSSWLFLNDAQMNNPIRIVVAAGDSGGIHQNFSFANRTKPMGASATGAWFYCAITYRDIFNQTDRHTFYYVKLVGANVSFPANPEYNRWD
jgi:hypothetical protein